MRAANRLQIFIQKKEKKYKSNMRFISIGVKFVVYVLELSATILCWFVSNTINIFQKSVFEKY